MPDFDHQEPKLHIRGLYNLFHSPVTEFDCGTKCAPNNPNGIPFCCDICQAVPAAYHQEWTYLKQNTDLWHVWRGDECTSDPEDPSRLLDETPPHMLLLACLGPARCQRDFRAMSCRQFPFFPYITSGGTFLGLACEWEFEKTCWVIQNLHTVLPAFRQEFVRVYDALFEVWEAEYESYWTRSEEIRAAYAAQKRRFPLLHRNGRNYLVSPRSERLYRIPSGEPQ